MAPPTMARSAAVDDELGGTLSASAIVVSGLTNVIRDGYILISSEARANAVVGLEGSQFLKVLAESFAEQPLNQYVMVGKTPRFSNVTAATCATVAVRRPMFYAEMLVPRPDFWWSGSHPSTMPAYEVLDRRLVPFYERIDKIVAGDWNSALGTKPNARALSAARLVLNALNGSALLPKKVVAGDEQVVLYFTSGARYSNIEVLNNGMTFVLHGDGQTAPKAVRFKLKDNLSAVLDAVRAHLA
jgi:hypothetical protein